MMKIIMFITLVIGLAFLSLGLFTYIDGVSSGQAGQVAGGMLFGIPLMSIGGAILLIDGIVYLIYRSRAKKVS